MRALAHPVLREAAQVYLVEGKAWPAYLYFFLFLAAVQVLTLFLPLLDPGGWMGAAQLFKISSVVVLLAGVYFTLRLVNQEYVPWRFATLKRWLGDGLDPDSLLGAQLALVALWGGLFVVAALPLMSWAAAIARAGVGTLASVLLMIFGYFATYGVWGLVALNLWEVRVETRHIAVRLFLGVLFLVTALVYLPLNSVAFILSYLGGTDLGDPVSLFGRRIAPGAVHVFFHGLLFAGGVGLSRWVLARRAGG
ncbi:MAG TPA: hypothetical protein VNL14_02730 [Candidatus Acidoferrales bacterium]|nr:hypothetical protein [Candidatus Acidoferrales bacterium]